MYTLLLRLLHHISTRRRIQFSILFLQMIIASFAEVVSIGAVLPFLAVLTAPDRVFSNHLAQPLIQALHLTEPKQLLLPIAIGFAIAVLFSGAMRLMLLLIQMRLSNAIGADFSINIYRRTLYQPYAVHVARNSSEIMAGMNNASSVVVSIILPIMTITSSILLLVTILLALVSIDPIIAISAFIGFGAIYALIVLITKNRLTREGKRLSREYPKITKVIQEGLGGIRDVLIDGTQATYCNIYRNTDLPIRRANGNIAIIGGSPRFVIEALGMILIAALAYSLAVRPEGLTTAIPVLGALTLGAQRLLPVLQQGYQSWTSIRGGEAMLKDTLDLLDQPLPDYANKPLPDPITFQHRITINKLSFRYAKEAPWVLKEVNLTIPKGSRVGFMGVTGSGKSTLLDIVMGLLQPTEGRLVIDGVPITLQNYRGWQRHIAHVPQAIFLSDTTIAENIAFGVPIDQIDYDRVQEAAQKAQISQTIKSWEKQYNTLVGERGIRLSGGQRQRIGIARALYKNADVLVFDEATSALDNETEHNVMEAIESLGDELTILIVAHRLTTLKNCTQIVELAGEGIQRIGTYLEIMGFPSNQ